MIISASRRTDIPAFYGEWFMNRIRAGYCTVPNPFNPTQVSHVSLKPEDVDVIVFWTRYPRPLFPFLPELDKSGYRYYFLYTLMDNPRLLDPKCPPLKASLKTFQELADRIGPEKVIWRYDPVVFSTATPADFHGQRYARIARALQGSTRRCVISIVDVYRKLQKRFRELAKQGLELLVCEGAGMGTSFNFSIFIGDKLIALLYRHLFPSSASIGDRRGSLFKSSRKLGHTHPQLPHRPKT